MRIPFKTLKGILNRIKKELGDDCYFTLLFAGNGSGKTRLSSEFSNVLSKKTFCYNAYFEDQFQWDNDGFILEVRTNDRLFSIIERYELDGAITNNFKKFTGLSLEPKLDFENGEVTFELPTSEGMKAVKISRGEESLFVWTVFYTVLEKGIENRQDESAEQFFDKLEYIVIDDPVSSMDDGRIVTVALSLKDLIIQAKEARLRFFVSTHHALFFNLLFNSTKPQALRDLFKEKKGTQFKRKVYQLERREADWVLKPDVKDAPFAYHYFLISKICSAIKAGDLKRYHFNLYRSLLEKTAAFLGYGKWREMFPSGTEESIKKLTDHFSHNALCDFESTALPQAIQESFKASFGAFTARHYPNLTKEQNQDE